MSARRLVLLAAGPVLFAITGLLHVVPAMEQAAGGDFDHVRPHADLWIGIHVVQLLAICLLAWAVAALTTGIGDQAAVVSRSALVPFVAFYSAFDASVGLSGGLLARYVNENSSTAGAVSQAADAVTDPLSAPVLSLLYLVAVSAWLIAVVGAAVAARQRGVSWNGPGMLIAGAVIFAIDHAAPAGPIGMAVFLIGAIVTDRARGQRARTPPDADRVGHEA